MDGDKLFRKIEMFYNLIMVAVRWVHIQNDQNSMKKKYIYVYIYTHKCLYKTLITLIKSKTGKI